MEPFRETPGGDRAVTAYRCVVHCGGEEYASPKMDWGGARALASRFAVAVERAVLGQQVEWVAFDADGWQGELDLRARDVTAVGVQGVRPSSFDFHYYRPPAADAGMKRR